MRSMRESRDSVGDACHRPLEGSTSQQDKDGSDDTVVSTPGPHTHADKILVCEVLTPAGNWSSYPPHKHDHLSDTEGVLEEIYYYEVRANDPAHKDADPIGFQRGSASDTRPINIATEVRTGDAVFIPYGWHGPSMAMPGYDLYYLNIMAGPGRREWLVTVEPDRKWVPESLHSQLIDSRLPLR